MIGRLALAQLGASAGDGQVVNDCRAVVMDVPLYPRVDGILGLSFLMHFQVRTPLCNLLFALLPVSFCSGQKARQIVKRGRGMAGADGFQSACRCLSPNLDGVHCMIPSVICFK